MLLLLLQLDLVAQVYDFAVHPSAHKTCFAHIFEDRLEFAFAALDQRRQDHDPRAFGHVEHGIDDLLGRLLLNWPVALRTVRVTNPREQQPQIIVDLGDRADRRTRVVAGALLVDRNGRRKARDVLDVGLVHLPQELARVGRQRFDVPPLALGIDGVEGERRLATARQASNDHQPVAREDQVDVLEVVLPRAADLNLVQGHRVN